MDDQFADRTGRQDWSDTPRCVGPISPSLYDQLLNRVMPPSLLVDEYHCLIESFGGAERFLRVRPHLPSSDVLSLVDEKLSDMLAVAIGQTGKHDQPVRMSHAVICSDGAEQTFNLTVTPVHDSENSTKHYLISFDVAGPDANAAAVEPFTGKRNPSRDHIRNVDHDLQATIEELRATNEELRATNEVLVAANDELQNANDELQHENEESCAVNAELRRKVAELAELDEDMHLLLENTDVATVFLDKELRVRRFTSKVTKVFDLAGYEMGRSIDSFLPRFEIDDLVGSLQEVISSEESRECETVAEDGTCYLMRMLPVRVEDIVEGIVLMFVDVSSMEELRDRLRWVSAIVESTDDAIIGQDLQGRITSWNAGAERLYGYRPDEAIGQHVSIMVPPERRGEMSEYRKTIAAGERLHTRDTVRVRKDGSEIHVSLTVSPVHDCNNQLIGISKIARDVSERIAMENEIRNQVHQREAFLATLSHELRNPLGAALNASRLIQDHRSDEAKRREAAQIVDRQIMMMRGLLSDLLDISRINQGKVELRRDTVDLCSLMDLVRETTLCEATAHRQVVSWEVPSNPVYVHGDATRLVQVQVNLIHNALKYSPEHTAVNVVIAQREGIATISVTDYGVGIPADQLENIFDPFIQVRGTRHQSEGGLGVGLTLVRYLVEAHGGTVKAESLGPGKGTTFVASLPTVSALPDEDSHGDTDDAKLDSSTSRSIVLIEDIDDSREMLSSLLTLDGHVVQTCCDGETGLATILEQQPDVALIDIGLPGMDGYDVARSVRNDPRGEGIVLIALTGFGQSSDVNQAVEAGFNSHLIKPIDTDSLSQMIAEIPESAGRR